MDAAPTAPVVPQAPAAPTTPGGDGHASTAAAAPVELPAWLKTLTISGLVDVYGAVNFNQPADHLNFIPGTGSTAKRGNEFALNLASLSIDVPAAPVGGKLQLAIGNATEVIHAGEPAGTAVGAAAFNSIYQAYLSVAVPFVEGLTLDGGVFSSHIGFESFQSNLNWNYTRGWLGELVPWYQTGVRATDAAPFLKGLTLQAHVLNGWQIIGDNNDAKSYGAQISYSNDALTATLNGWAGPELPKDNDHWRFYVDSVVMVKPVPWLAIAASADVGTQQLPGNSSATWWVGGVYARVNPLDWLAVAGRVEHVDDPQNGITGTAQAMNEGTLTVEFMPTTKLSLKLEGRFDQSSAAVFSAGNGQTSRTEVLALVGAVASF
jgi:hypothetical protein